MEDRINPKARLALLILACGSVCAALVAGCSSGSGGSHDDAEKKHSAAPTAPAVTSTTPTVAPARFATLPSACGAITDSTVADLVPKAKSSKGTPTGADDEKGTRGGCSWTGNGKDGYQYRWLSVTLERFDSSTAVGSGEDQARKRFTDEAGELAKTPGLTATPVSGLGDQASSVSGKATVAKVTSQNDTVVVRTGNVVVIVEYDGAGLEDKKNPSATTIDSGAQRAAKDVLAAVGAANGPQQSAAGA